MRIVLVDQVDLPRSMPVLELLLADNGPLHVPEHFEMDEPVDAVARGEARQRIVAMLPQPREEVGGYADVKRAVGLARKDIDAGVSLFAHGPEFGARWVLKQVQDDEAGKGPVFFVPPLTPNRHAELVSASIVPRAQVSENETASAVYPLMASAQTGGWVLKQVQDDEEGKGSNFFAPLLTHSRHAELVSASIAPRARRSENETASAVRPLKASAQTGGWVLKQVQDDEEGKGSNFFAPLLTHSRHAELVSASIVPRARRSENGTASAVYPLKASAQTDGWILKQVQDDGVFEVIR